MDINTLLNYRYGEKKAESLKQGVNQGGDRFDESSSDHTYRDELSLYEDICNRYPNVSFRMEDMRSDDTQKLDFHQSKKGFGNAGTVSISIDRTLLARAVSDEKLEKQIIGSVDTIIYNYSNLTQGDRSSNGPYCCMSLTDHGGQVQWETTHSASPFSTDQEINQQREEYHVIDRNNYQRIIRNAKQKTLETLFDLQKNTRR